MWDFDQSPTFTIYSSCYGRSVWNKSGLYFLSVKTYFYIMHYAFILCLRVPWPTRFNQHKHIFSGSLNQISPIEVFCSLKVLRQQWRVILLYGQHWLLSELVWSVLWQYAVQTLSVLAVQSERMPLKKYLVAYSLYFFSLFWIFLDCMALVEWSENCS